MILYRISPDVQNHALNVLFDSAWENFKETDFVASFDQCALWVCAYEGETLVGFVKVVWDGGIHGFVLDTTVHPDCQRRGIGKQLLRRAADASKARGIKILHVDFEPHLTQFYRDAGYKQTGAGLLRLFCTGQ